MALDFIESAVVAVLSAATGGGAVSLVKARSEARQHEAQAEAITAKSEPEATDISVSTVVRVNEQLKRDYERVVAERDDIMRRFQELRASFEELQQRLDQTQADLRRAHEATQQLQSRLEALMSALPDQNDEEDDA